MSLWQSYLATQFDPAHLLSELGFSVVFELIQLGIAALWFRKIHRSFDKSHGLTHRQGPS